MESIAEMAGRSGYKYFESAKAKLGRGLHHIAEFESTLAAFVASRPYRLGGSVKGVENHTVSFDAMPPPSLMLSAGDAIHNLRSALDHLIWEVARLDSKFERAEAYFPCDTDRSNYEGKLKNFVGRPQTQQLLKEIEAYVGGEGELIYYLNRLNITDKHHVLVPAVEECIVRGLRTESLFGEGERFTSLPDRTVALSIPRGAPIGIGLSNGLGDVGPVRGPGGKLNIDAVYEIEPILRFAHASPRPDLSIAELLRLFAGKVQQVIERFVAMVQSPGWMSGDRQVPWQMTDVITSSGVPIHRHLRR